MSDANKPTVFGLEVAPLPRNATPLEAVTIVKTLNSDGEISLAVRSTQGLAQWDIAVLLRAAEAITVGKLVSGYTPLDEDDDAT